MDQDIIVIDMASEAGAKLEQFITSPNVYTISIHPRGAHHVAIKVNEAMWSHSMRCNFLDSATTG